MPSKTLRKPTQLKKIVYLVATTVLGVLLSVIVYALLEINYVHWALRHNYTITFYSTQTFRRIIQIVCVGLGAYGGLVLGRSWWQMVYVEKCRFFGKRKKRK